MQSRWGAFSSALMEAGWLAALLVVPVFFNIYSGRIFEPDKISILRSVALIIALAMLVRAVESGSLHRPLEGLKKLLRWPLVVPTLALACVYLLTTLSSIVPGISLWGSYQRLQGTYTMLSYIVIFFAILSALRIRGQLERIITIILVASIPVAIYGVIQHFSLDPLPWKGDVTFRVASTLGNSIFLGAYLIMVIPLALSRFLESLFAFLRNSKPSSGPSPLRTGGKLVLSAALVIQGLCLLCLFVYQLFFLADLNYAAGGTSLLLSLSAALFALSAVFVWLICPRWGGISDTLRGAAISLLFLAQGLALTYGLLSLFRFNYLQGGPRLEFLGLGSAMVIFAIAFWFSFREERIGTHILTLLYAFCVILQTSCLIFAQSRGPLLGLLAGLLAFVLMLVVRRNLRWLIWGALGLALAGGLFLVLFNLPQSPLSALQDVPYIGRLGQVFETESGTGKVRVLIWEGALRLIAPHEPLGSPPHEDRLNLLRPLVGYGPESMYLAYSRFFPPELGHYEARNRSPDRSHNETLDALVTTGLVGFFAYIALFSSVFYYGLRWLGLIQTSAQRNAFFALWSGGGVLGVVLPRIVDGTWRFSGVGLAVGAVAGLVAYLVARGISLKGTLSKVPFEMPLMAIFAALVAHFVEIHFGIAIAATRTYFWVYAALLVLMGSILSSQAEGPRLLKENLGRTPAKKKGAPSEKVTYGESHDETSPLVVLALIVGLLLITLAFIFMGLRFELSSGGFSIPWLFVVTWTLVSCLLLAEMKFSKASAFAYGITSLGLLAVYLFFQGLIFHPASNIASIADVLSLAWLATDFLTLYYLSLLAILLTYALVSSYGQAHAFTSTPWSRRITYLVLAVVVMLFMVVANFNPIRADVVFAQRLTWEQQGVWDASIALSKDAMRLSPNEDWYYLYLAQGLVEKAKEPPEGGEHISPPTSLKELLAMGPSEVAHLDQDGLMGSAILVLERAREISPLNTDHVANLARVYYNWGTEMTSDPALRAARLQEASGYFQEAIALSPNNVSLFNDWGRVYLALGDYEGAILRFRHSFDLDARYEETYLLLADAYAAQAHGEAMPDFPQEVRRHVESGYLLAGEGKYAEALEEFFTVAALVPSDFGTRARLATMLYQTGRRDEALEQARIARDLAPPDAKSFWEALVQYWEGE